MENTNKKRIVLIGASGHGKVCADIAELLGYGEILFLDDDQNLENCGRYKVAGSSSDFEKFIDNDTVFFVSIGNAQTRKRIQSEIIRNGATVCKLIHPNSVIGSGVYIGEGTAVMAGAVLNSGAIIGNGCIVNTCSSVDHDCKIGEFCHISVGAHVSGTVEIGNDTWIGAGAIAINNIKICRDCMIGAGAVVVNDICIPGTYVGVPARMM